MLLKNMLVSSAIVAASVGFSPMNEPNMNGEYLTSDTPNAKGKFPTEWKNYPGGVEYFDVYHGPITSTYGQVWWTSTSNDIPDDVVKRFDGKGMAIVGFEVDQVRKTPEGDVSVPINMAYNHHHDTAVHGKSSHLEKMDQMDARIPKSSRDFIRLDKKQAWVAVEDEKSPLNIPTSAMFSDGNGGEYRKTFHAYAPPFAQLVDSPTTFAGSPMQIDTWNRDKMNITGGPFVSGPVPKHSLAPVSGPDAIYSGLLECPITTRIAKIIDGNGGFNDTYHAEIGSANSGCQYTVANASECFAAAVDFPGLSANASITTKTVSDDTLPKGCSVSASSDGNKAQFVFNTMVSSTIVCEANEVAGSVSAFVTLGLHLTDALATVTMTGPEGVWFGVGFNATLMADLPYAIVVDGVTGNVSEHKMGNHAEGTVLASTVKVVSNTVSGSMRTVVVTRPLAGATPDHYTFQVDALALDFINAIGSTPTMSYHSHSGVSTLNLWPVNNGAACVCKEPAAAFGNANGVLKYLPTGETLGFKPGRCSPSPRTDLIDQRNPTCDIRTYIGGLETCHHGWILLDAEQEQPWTDQPLVYYKKFRIYYQEYNASFHKQISRSDWGIGADGDHSEYDVPQCAEGTPVEQCTHTITGTWMPIPANDKNVHIVLAHFHCHAPTCLKIEMWNNDTNTLICRQLPVFGGSGKIDVKKFDEDGYIAVPPCMWGSPEHGLEPPLLVSGVTIKVISVTNNTYGHHGEMALPEMSFVTLD